MLIHTFVIEFLNIGRHEAELPVHAQRYALFPLKADTPKYLRLARLGGQLLLQSRYHHLHLGPVNFAFTGTSTTQSSSLTYSSAIVNTNLKVPTMGLTNLNYLILLGRALLQVKVTSYTATGLTFSVTVNTRTNLNLMALTYMALDNSFTPAFSMNYFFPVSIISFRALPKQEAISTHNSTLISQPPQE